jgi:hypothetical protein
VARSLPPSPGEHHVFRAAVLSFVLTLAAGPNTTLLCAVWCHSDAARPSDCQHQAGILSPQLTGEDSCRTAPAGVTALLREEATRRSATAGAHHAEAIPRFHVAPSQTDARRASQLATSPGADVRRVLIALRI